MGDVGQVSRVGRVGRLALAFVFLILIVDRSVVWADDAVRLMVGRSTVVSLGAPIARVSLTSADVADALVTSPNELLINGKTPGTISMFVWDRAGSIKRYEIIVQRDLARLSEQIKQLFPKENIDVQSNGRNIVLAGTVTNKDVIERAANLASGYVDKKDEIVTLLRLQEGAPTNQVLLKVRFAEVSRSAITELGASFFTSPTGVKNTIGRVTTQQFPSVGYDELKYSKESAAWGADVTNASGKFTFSDFLNIFLFSEKYDLGTMIRVLQTRGLFQSLAEPNLVAESGKEASFLAGGEFPVPIAQGGTNGTAITVMFKEFGIRLNFTPIVTGDRVHLKVKPEVSTLDFSNAIVLQGFRIPALSTRRTETELELQNGQTFAIAGLLNNTMNKTLQKIPGIGDIPILGLLFKSQAAQKNQTELVVMITPQILANNSPGVTRDLPRTPESFMPPQDQRKSLAPQAPAFPSTGGRPGDDNNNAANQAQPAARPAAPAATGAQSTAPATDAASAAAKVQALTPSAPKVSQPAAAPAASRPATPTPAGSKADHERAEAAKAVDGKQRAKQIDVDRKRAEEDRKVQDKAAREQMKKDEAAAKAAAVAAKRQAAIDKAANEVAAKRAVEQAKRQAEVDKQNQKAISEAEAKLKAAQAAYQAEVAKSKKQ